MRVEDSILRNQTNVRSTMPYGVTGGGAMLPPRRVELHRVLFGDVPGYTGADPQSDVRPEFNLEKVNTNAILSSRIVVTEYNRVPGDNFEVFQEQQAPSFVVPPNGVGRLYRLAGAGSHEPADVGAVRHRGLRPRRAVLQHPATDRRICLRHSGAASGTGACIEASCAANASAPDTVTRLRFGRSNRPRDFRPS